MLRSFCATLARRAPPRRSSRALLPAAGPLAALLLAALLLAALLPVAGGAQSQVGSAAPGAVNGTWMAPELRQEVSRSICREVKAHFVHWEAVPELDFDARCAAFRDRAVTTLDRREFALMAMELFAELRNGHTSYWDSWVARTYGQPVGFDAVTLDGRWVVTRSALPAPRPGDVLEAIDGAPVAAVLEDLLRYVAASSRRQAEHQLFARPFLFPQRFTLTLAGGEQVVIDRPAQERAPGPAATVEARWLESDSVAYLRIPSFGEDGFEAAALERLKEYRRSPALIVDLRGNGGGNTPWRLRKALASGSYRTWDVVEEAKEVRPGLLFRAIAPLAVALARVPSYDGRLILLTDAGCGSACEDLVVSLKDSGRALVLGDTTSGSTGQPVVRTFEDGIGFRVGARRVAFPDGSPFEGIGIAPDEVIRPTPEDLRAGRDPVLARALGLAR
jgi:carboxyl-terminal processing protease